MTMTDSLPAYTLKRSARSRHIRLQVSAGGKVLVTAPTRISESVISNFIQKNISWLNTKIEHFSKVPEPKLTVKQNQKLYIEYKEQALEVARVKAGQWNKHYKLVFKKIAIRNSVSRWGSCSSLGTISFNYKIIFLPTELADYLVVHELCHLKEKNHGEGFWSLVEQTVPDYKSRRKALHEFEKTFTPPMRGV